MSKNNWKKGQVFGFVFVREGMKICTQEERQDPEVRKRITDRDRRRGEGGKG